MEYLPLFINFNNRSVLVVGGGIVAFRKIQMLRRSGAIVQIVAESLCSNLKKMLIIKYVVWIGQKFYPDMLNDVFLVIVATNDTSLNKLIYQYAEKHRVLINTVDDQSKCSCIFPAIIDRSPIIIGISSCGKSPVLIRILREKLESFLPKSIGRLAELAGKWRNIVKKHIKYTACRRYFWENFFYHGNVSLLIDQGNFKKANSIIRNVLKSNKFNKRLNGHIILVGAGPGDTGLLTIKGLQVIQQADVILYDSLVNPDILDFSRRDANKIYVGKSANKHSISQDKLNNFMIHLALQGNNVVRLKGGDPFIFGRGGEELQAISNSGIAFQVVPGITAGIGVSAYAGIPLTHREYAHSVTFITGHKKCNEDYQINWKALSDNQQTIVIYMGKINAMNISKNLIFYGRHVNTPVAIISKGTYQDQKIFIGTLIRLEKLVSFVERPTLLIIGNVVSLHKNIAWFRSDTFCDRFFK